MRAEGEGGRGADAWPRIKAPRNALHHITETQGAGAPKHIMEARSDCNKFIEEFRFGILFDLFEGRNYGFGALIL